MPSFQKRTTTRPLDLFPNKEVEVSILPGRDGELRMRIDAGGENCPLTAAIVHPDGAVTVLPATKFKSFAATHVIGPGDPGLGRAWKVRLKNDNGSVSARGDLVIEYQAAVDELTVPLAKLNELVAVAVKEARPSITLSGGKLFAHLDASLDGHLPKAWRIDGVPATFEVALSLPLGLTPKIDVTLTTLVVGAIEVVFVPVAPDLPAGGVEVTVSVPRVVVRKLGAALATVKGARLKVRLGLGLTAERLDVRPVIASITGDTGGPAEWFTDFKGKLTAMVKDQLEGAFLGELRDELRMASDWIRKLFRMDELLDLRITPQGLQMKYTTAPAVRVKLVDGSPLPPSGRLKRLIVIMMENRSFDHMLGGLLRAGVQPDVAAPAAYSENFDHKDYALRAATVSRIKDDAPHGAGSQELQAKGRWVEAMFRKARPNGTDPGEVLTFQPPENVPVYRHLLEHACVCTDWRAAIPGETWPNRNYALSGTSKGVLENSERPFDFYDFLSICDVLERQGVAWKYYRSDVAFLELYRRWALDDKRVRWLDEFHKDARDNTLPQVCWIEPNIADFGVERATDDHPPADMKFGQGFLADIYASLAELSKEDQDWLLVVTYDEHGGFYDSQPAGGPAPDEFARTAKRGFRVPAFFVSPWLGKSVCSVAFDHASIVRTILDHFCEDEPALRSVPRVGAATSFAGVLDGTGAVADGWPAPRASSVPLPPLDPPGEGFHPPQLMGDPPPIADVVPATEAWQRVRALQKDLRHRRESSAQQEGVLMGGGDGAELAAFESLHVQLGAGGTAAAVQAALPGWTLRPLFDSDDALEAVPPDAKEPEIADGWNAVHALRKLPGLRLVEPLWRVVMEQPFTSGEPVPTSRTWALDLMRAREAWALPSPSGAQRGAGIVVAHLDTGVLPKHVELADAIDDKLAWDYVADQPGAIDPLTAGALKFPGHGTATASVIASRGPGEILGAAPEATVLPMRISPSVVHLSMRRMVAAIERAVDSGAHVISISAGGLWSAALHRAVRRAARAGVIVVAAAGNVVPFVVWPARYPEVIAVGACDVDGVPWESSSRGPAVDVSAPGVHVWCAGAAPAGIRVGTGTSFATALVSGAVATWLSFHGRDALIARHGAAGLVALARTMLARACVPLAGDPGGNGAGLVDLEALLRLPLPEADVASLMGGGPPAPAPEPIDAIAEELAAEDDPLSRLPLDQRAALGDELAFHGAIGRLQGEPWTAVAARLGSARLKAALGL